MGLRRSRHFKCQHCCVHNGRGPKVLYFLLHSTGVGPRTGMKDASRGVLLPKHAVDLCIPHP